MALVPASLELFPFGAGFALEFGNGMKWGTNSMASGTVLTTARPISATVLIVDDEDSTRNLCKDVVTDSGMRTRMASTTGQSQQALHSGRLLVPGSHFDRKPSQFRRCGCWMNVPLGGSAWCGSGAAANAAPTW